MSQDEKKEKPVLVAEEKKAKKIIDFRDMTTCPTTLQMLKKAEADGVETLFTHAGRNEALPHRG